MAALFKQIPWETRNLGVQSFALDIENNTDFTIETLDSELSALAHSFAGQGYFVQARVPKEYLEQVAMLESRGFYFIESTIEPYARLKNFDSLDSFERNPSSVLPSRFTEKEIAVTTSSFPHDKFANAVRSVAGTSFSDDRFHHDFKCTKEVADKRFVFWVDDLMSKQSVVFDMLSVRGECAGFMARDAGNLILAGFSPTYARSGLGEFLWLSSLSIIRNTEIREAETLISVNNIPVLNLYVRMGFRFRSPCVTLHYWSGPQ